MSRFPKLTETFVLYEILAVERAGVDVELYPLVREHQPVTHPEADALTRRAHVIPHLSGAVLATQLWWLARHPRRYLSTLAAVARGTWGSANFFLGGLAVFPKAAHAGRDMRARGVTHVHCHFANHPAVAGFVVSRLTSIPYSFTAHGHDLHVERRMLGAKLAEAAFAVTVSESNLELIRRECPEVAGKVQVLHCGVDPDVFAPRPGAGPRRPGPLRVACVGTLHEVKGQRHLIEAIALLAGRGVHVDAALVGDGPDRGSLLALAAEHGVADRVRFAGPLPRAGVVAMLQDVDVVVAPSVPTRSGKREGIPVALMEAMASGTAVVASRLSGIPELVDHEVSGLLVGPGDTGALADALARLASDPDLVTALGRAGRARVQRDFDLHGTAAVLAERFMAGAPAWS